MAEFELRKNVPLLDDKAYELVDGNHLFYMTNISPPTSQAKHIFLMGRNGSGKPLFGTSGDTSAQTSGEAGDGTYNLTPPDERVSGLDCDYDIYLAIIFIYDGPDPNKNYYLTPDVVKWDGNVIGRTFFGSLPAYRVAGNTRTRHSLYMEHTDFETLDINNYVGYLEDRGFDCPTWSIFIDGTDYNALFQYAIPLPE